MAVFESRSRMGLGFAHLVSVVAVVPCLVILRYSTESPGVLGRSWKIVHHLARHI